MNATAIQSSNRTHHLIKANILLMATILFLTGGTAYASHRHHEYTSGLPVTFDYIYYPNIHLYQDTYSYPRHTHHYNNYYYRANYGRHKPWRNKHGHKHHRKHHNGHHYD
ncbi:MAG: hypothetical protein U9N50_04915 [Pseudomonadota bacterium]|nr:hypothetical protein [Pseudomonadota bacterium]